jgi:SAM-dependent MidA family methyltransferase
MTDNSSLKERLIEQIRAGGPIPFEDFMAAALYDPTGGFFTSKSLRSVKGGDFLTSPEVSPLFGETLAKFVEKELSTQGGSQSDDPPATSGSEGADSEKAEDSEDARKDSLSRRRERVGERVEETPLLVEIGAGSGSLLKPLLATLRTAVEPWVVEASPAAREALRELIDPDHIVATLDQLPDHFSGVVVANELLDNLPVAIAVRTGQGWTERWVGVEDDDLVLVPIDARPEVADWAEQFGLPAPGRGLVEVQLAAGEWLESLLARLESGTVALIDYGDTAGNLEKRRVEGTLRTYRAHHLGPHPLDEPGETDITVDVNFTALVDRAVQLGASVEYHRQDDFLKEFGLRARLSKLRHQELDLARDGDPMERLKVRSTKTEAETLLHPRGLGDFRVLVVRK